jgi:pimeloyl-ACP methyl ester carboxylesterase
MNLPEQRGRHDGLGLLLLNAGLVHRVGPHRINVKLARRAAQRGLASLRFDLSGLGDSAPGEPGGTPLSRAVADIRAAADLLAESSGCRRFMCFGICSGADNGLAAALEDERIVSLVLFDPPIFPTLRWWLRIYSAKVRKFGLIGGFRQWRERRTARLQREDEVLGNYGRELPPVGEYAGMLRTLDARGVSIDLVYSGSGLDGRDYRSQVKAVLGAHGLVGRVRAEFMPRVNHVITSIEAQRQVLDRFDAWLDEVPTVVSADRIESGDVATTPL